MKKSEVLKKLGELEDLRRALLGQVANMSNDEKIKALEAAQPKVEPKTPEMEALLRAGYPNMTVKKAKAIIEERKKDPHSWPYEQQELAETFLAAYEGGKREPTSTRAPWRSRPRA